ncbi:hypothetical protein J437_LFUL010024 [Ladona fulva]|uniref:PiggyBac transposable element-derived protein domain-containing protein n=1 Tax=Ladona fulva TaxID=123851 RepID=A0A8K0KAW5_LADFU|nr:hypothetical protein J437_LFUL010024 [Ladona fulva]
MNLLAHLKKCGTMEQEQSEKTIKKEQRGKSYSAILKRDGIAIIKWLDNSVVTVASTAYGVTPLMNVRRFCGKQRKIIQVPQSQPYFAI